MKWISFVACAALVAVSGTSSSAFGQYQSAKVQEASYFDGYSVFQDGSCDTSLDDDCCGGGGIVFQAETLVFKYFRADGVRAGSFNNVPPATTDDVVFHHSSTPRLTFGYIGDGGLGGRIRYWEFDHAGAAVFPAAGVTMGVDTFVVDFELFENVQLTDCWTVEFSGGVRYNDFTEQMFDPVPLSNRINEFKGYGGVLGMEGKRTIGPWGSFYGRCRTAILMDDKYVLNSVAGVNSQEAILNDVNVGMLEIAMGYEFNRVLATGSIFTLRLGYEWQNWFNYSSSFTPVTTTPPGNPPASFAGNSDVGFSGISVLVGFQR